MKGLLEKVSPRPAAVAEQHEESAPAKAGSSIVTPGDLSRRAVDPGDVGNPGYDPDSSAEETQSSIFGTTGDSGNPLDSLSTHIRRYLVCDKHQLTILALWTLYTWCFGTTMSVWNSNSGRRLGALLDPFEISSRTIGPSRHKAFKGYRRSDFYDAWKRYLPPIPAPASRGAPGKGSSGARNLRIESIRKRSVSA